MEEPHIEDPSSFLEKPFLIGPRLPKNTNIENESVREAFFQQVALKSFQIAQEFVLKKTGRPLLPPPTYQGARVKSEEDIQRIIGVQKAEEDKKKASEEAKKQRYLAKYAKQAQTEAKLRKENERREQAKKLQDIRKTKDDKNRARKLDSFISGDDDFDIGLEEEDDSTKPAAKKYKKPEFKVSSKRAHKNEKFGYGGKKRGLKRNTKESLNDDSSFSVKKNKAGFNGSRGKKPIKNRPGKQRRQQTRNRKASQRQKK